MSVSFVVTLLLGFAAPMTGGRASAAEGMYGPFFEAEAPSDASYSTTRRPSRTPVLAVGNGAFCFVEGTYCRTAWMASAAIETGLRVPAGDLGPELPFSQATFRGGLAFRPMMFRGRDWHPWGVGVIGSWSRGTGAATLGSAPANSQLVETDHTDSTRVALVNQLWLSRKAYAMHLDVALGGVRSPILTSESTGWGVHAELAFAWDGWIGLQAVGDFLEDDTRVTIGLRGHALVAGPILALTMLGLALGGAR